VRTRNLKAIGFMLAAVASFAFMDASMKQLAEHYSPMQVTFLRGAASLPFLLAALAWSGAWGELRSVRPGLQLLRGLLGIVMLVTFIYALQRLTLADTYAVFMCAPLLVTALSVPLLGERVPLRRWGAVSVGLLGVLVVLQPTGAGLASLGGLAAVASALVYALVAITTRILGRTDSSRAIVVWFIAIMTLGSGAAAVTSWSPVPAAHLPWIAFIGVTGALGQYFITESFRSAPPAVVAPFEYTALLWAIGLDWVLWLALPDARMLVGAVIVVASGLYIIFDERRLSGR
jgi:drug/metabolite transporter (DMT)-like permease